MATNNCSIRSITLAPGESYVLPSNAEVMFTTNNSLLTSQDGCLVLPDSLSKCYFIEVSQAVKPGWNNSAVQGIDYSNMNYVILEGLDVDGVYYPFETEFDVTSELATVQVRDGEFIPAAPQTSLFKKEYIKIFGFVELFGVYTYASSQLLSTVGGNHSLIYQLKIPEKIGANLKVRARAQMRGRPAWGLAADSTLTFNLYFVAKPFSEWNNDGGSGIGLISCTDGN